MNSQTQTFDNIFQLSQQIADSNNKQQAQSDPQVSFGGSSEPKSVVKVVQPEETIPAVKFDSNKQRVNNEKYRKIRKYVIIFIIVIVLMIIIFIVIQKLLQIKRRKAIIHQPTTSQQQQQKLLQDIQNSIPIAPPQPVYRQFTEQNPVDTSLDVKMDVESPRSVKSFKTLQVEPLTNQVTQPILAPVTVKVSLPVPQNTVNSTSTMEPVVEQDEEDLSSKLQLKQQNSVDSSNYSQNSQK